MEDQAVGRLIPAALLLLVAGWLAGWLAGWCRYQRCIIMAAPYIDRLRRAGVRRVADLSRIDLPSWGFEPAYTKQVGGQRGRWC